MQQDIPDDVNLLSLIKTPFIEEKKKHSQMIEHSELGCSRATEIVH
jgi:hypothetical protein